VINPSEAVVMKEKNCRDRRKQSVESKIKWKIIFPERGKIAFRAGHEKMG